MHAPLCLAACAIGGDWSRGRNYPAKAETMILEKTGGKRAGLGAMWMAGALVLAAFTGAALGLVWQSAGLGDDSPKASGSHADDAPADSG